MLGLFRYIQGIVKLMGATDNTPIGNVGDSLKVTGEIEDKKISSKFRADFSETDITVSNGGYTQLYNYNGSGVFYSCGFHFEDDSIFVRLTIDGETIFDLRIDRLDNVRIGGDDPIANHFMVSSDKIYFWTNRGISYSSSVVIEARKASSGTERMFESLVCLTKES